MVDGWQGFDRVGCGENLIRGHDDLLISAALAAVLDKQEWPGTGQSATVAQEDVLDEIDRAEW